MYTHNSNYNYCSNGFFFFTINHKSNLSSVNYPLKISISLRKSNVITSCQFVIEMRECNYTPRYLQFSVKRFPIRHYMFVITKNKFNSYWNVVCPCWKDAFRLFRKYYLLMFEQCEFRFWFSGLCGTLVTDVIINFV